MCTLFGLDPSTSAFDTLPCCEQGIPADSQVVVQSFLSRSFSSKRSSHMTQAHMWYIVPFCGWKPWNFGSQYFEYSGYKDLDPAKGKGLLICLISLDSLPALQCQVSSKVGHQEWFVGTCHKLSCCPTRVVYFQGGCSPLGRSKREQVQKEEDCLPCQESGELDGATVPVRLCCQL